jgi:hypothetical protein
MVNTGCASGSRFSTVGCVIVRGRSGKMRLTLSRTSCVATSTSLSSVKFTTTCDTPSEEVDVRVSMPLMVLTASSILSVTSLSTCSDRTGQPRGDGSWEVDVRKRLIELAEAEDADDGQRG